MGLEIRLYQIMLTECQNICSNVIFSLNANINACSVYNGGRGVMNLGSVAVTTVPIMKAKFKVFIILNFMDRINVSTLLDKWPYVANNNVLWVHDNNKETMLCKICTY